MSDFWTRYWWWRRTDGVRKTALLDGTSGSKIEKPRIGFHPETTPYYPTTANGANVPARPFPYSCCDHDSRTPPLQVNSSSGPFIIQFYHNFKTVKSSKSCYLLLLLRFFSFRLFRRYRFSVLGRSAWPRGYVVHETRVREDNDIQKVNDNIIIVKKILDATKNVKKCLYRIDHYDSWNNSEIEQSVLIVNEQKLDMYFVMTYTKIVDSYSLRT